MTHPLPNPHTSLSPLPFNPVRDVRDNLWTYRILRSLQSNTSKGQLLHCPYYRPFSALDSGFTAPPFLIGADHYFEWRSSLHQEPICTLLISVHLGFQFTFPQVLFANSITHSCPSITILWWDIPVDLPFQIIGFLEELDEELFDENLDLFNQAIQEFLLRAYQPISPYNTHPAPLRSSHPTSLPLTPSNPYTIPLIYHK